MYRGIFGNPSVARHLPTKPHSQQLIRIARCNILTALLASSASASSRSVASVAANRHTKVESTSTGGQHANSTVASVQAVYVHLPFCKRKCFYCDFPVEAVGRDLNAPKVEARMRTYVDTLLREMRSTRRLGIGPLKTVFFGGGTPSLLPPALLGLLLEALDNRFGLAADAEISMEADPGTFDGDRLRQYRQLGVTRLSVGVQAFQQDLLEACGRGHDLSDVVAAVEAVNIAGIPSWSLDLISGLPGLTAEAWRYSLQRAVEAAPDHVSVYDLQVEEGTPFERWQRAGRLRLPPDDAAVEMYSEASELLRAAGYEHYEVSNYARPGHRCAHNQVYWRGLPYYAFGLGAASYLAGRRFSRPARMREYVDWVSEALGEDTLPGSHLPEESQEELLLDTLMLRLRTADGLDLTQLRNRFGIQALATVLRALAPHERHGTVLTFDSQNRTCSLGDAAIEAAQGVKLEPLQSSLPNAPPRSAGWGKEPVDIQHGGAGARVRLSDPRGFLLSNDIISDVFAAFDISQAAAEACSA